MGVIRSRIPAIYATYKATLYSGTLGAGDVALPEYMAVILEAVFDDAAWAIGSVPIINAGGTQMEFVAPGGGGAIGDMSKSVYDTNDDGVVNDSDALGGYVAAAYWVTGLMHGGELTVNSGDDTKLDIDSGAGLVVDDYTDPTNPTLAVVSWANKTVSLTHIAQQPVSFIGIDAAGNILQSTVPFTPTQLRTYIYLGRVVHEDKAHATICSTTPNMLPTRAHTPLDIVNYLGPICISGVVVTPNGANRFLDISSGAIYAMGCGYPDYKVPNYRTFGGLSTPHISLVYQDGSGGFIVDSNFWEIDTDNYDDGSGTLSAIGAGDFINYRVYLWSSSTEDVVYAVYGQTVYASLAEAIAGIELEAPILHPMMSQCLLRCVISVEGGTNNLGDPTKAYFTRTSGTGGGSGGGGDMLKATYDPDNDGVVSNADNANYATNAGDADTLDGMDSADFALVGHNHDLAYSPIGHDHDLVYSPIGHDHALLYSPIGHDHDGTYAALVHNHDLNYAPLVHNHDLVYSPIGHDHDLVYSAIGHNHDLDYAPLVHNHDLSYAPLVHTHPGSDITSAVALAEGIDNGTYAATAAELENSVNNVAAISRFGFVDRSETTISFNDTTYYFTLTSVGASWRYIRSGQMYTITGNKSVKLPVVGMAPPVADTYFIYIDTVDGTLTVHTDPWTLADTKVPVAEVMWDNTLTPKYHLMDERHTASIDRVVHRYLHQSRGTQIISGGTVDDYVVPVGSPVGDDDNTFSIEESVIADEDLFHTLAQLLDPSGAVDAYTVFYRTALSTWTWDMSEVPFRYTAAGYIQYDNGGSMTQGTFSKYYNTYLLLTNLTGDARFVIVHGRSEFSKLADAQAEEFGSFDFTGFSIAEAVAVWQFTWTTSNSYATKGKCKLAAQPVRVSVTVTSAVVPSAMPYEPLGAVAVHEATYEHTDIPSTMEKDALGGTYGTPSTSNKYVTDTDPRLSDPVPVAVLSDQQVTGEEPGPLAKAQFYLKPSDNDASIQYRVRGILSATGPSVPGVTMTVQLYNLDDGELVTDSLLTCTDTATPTLYSSNWLVPEDVANKIQLTAGHVYEWRIELTAGADPNDIGLVSAWLEKSYS